MTDLARALELAREVLDYHPLFGDDDENTLARALLSLHAATTLSDDERLGLRWMRDVMADGYEGTSDPMMSDLRRGGIAAIKKLFAAGEP